MSVPTPRVEPFRLPELGPGVARALRPLLFTSVMLGVVASVVAWVIERYYEVPLSPENLRFERPWAGLLLLGALLAWVVRAWFDRSRRPRLRVSNAFDLVRVQQGWKRFLPELVNAMRVTTLALLAFGLMGPQSIHARNATDVEGIDIVLALDLSGSMQAADIRPNRFVATQHVVDEFIHRRPNDRIGSVVFGRDAYTLLPLTTDHEALRTMIAELELGVINEQGTAIGNAIGVSLNRLRSSEAKSKVIILLTDGDSNSGNLSPTQAAEYAASLGVKVYTVLMGQSDEAPVQQGIDLFGRPLFNRGGNFAINPELLRKVASSTGGESFVASDRESLERSFHAILNRLERSQIEDAGRVYGELFPAFVAPALVLLVLEALLGTMVLRRWP